MIMIRNARLRVVLVLFTTVLVALLGVNAPHASADTVFTIDTANAPLLAGCPTCTGPYATVDVHLANSTTATITFDSLTNNGYIYLLGDGSSAAVNVNATSFSVSGISGSNSVGGFTPGPYSNGGSGTVDGFHVFNQTINSFDGFTHSSTEIIFTLTDISGTWASASDVLTPNSSGYTVAAHPFACALPCTTTEGAATTGFATNGGGDTNNQVHAPEPATILPFALGLAGLAAAARRRRGHPLQ